MKQRDPGGAIRIVLDCGDASGNAGLVSPKVDETVVPLVPASAVTRGNSPAIIPAGMLLQRLDQALLRLFLGYLLEGADTHRASPRRGRFIDANWHLFFLPSLRSSPSDLLEDVDA